MIGIGPNPTLIRHEWRKPRLHDNTDRRFVIARSYAARTLRKLLAMPEYRHAHRSFAVRDTLLILERKYGLPTFGVEHIEAGSNKRSPEITYLNSGDTYDTTILYVRGQFRLGCWGDIVEKGNYQ